MAQDSHYRDQLTDFHNVCDDAGVPAGNTGLRVRWLVERVGNKRKDEAMNGEQIQKRAEETAGRVMVFLVPPGSSVGELDMQRATQAKDIIAAALREARDEALEEAAKVADHREEVWRGMYDKHKERTFSHLADGAHRVADAIRGLKGTDHEG